MYISPNAPALILDDINFTSFPRLCRRCQSCLALERHYGTCGTGLSCLCNGLVRSGTHTKAPSKEQAGTDLVKSSASKEAARAWPPHCPDVGECAHSTL